MSRRKIIRIGGDSVMLRSIARGLEATETVPSNKGFVLGKGASVTKDGDHLVEEVIERAVGFDVELGYLLGTGRS
ncbi:MAG: hypothetical protein M1389_05490 [Chloroflexi bacterium]|nr:hypothetical protein [Chloroflexota bacterium]